MSSKTLIQHNIEYLEQAQALLEEVSDECYTECRAPFFTSGIGDHLRHIIEHYQCFLRGFDSGTIDYDSRKRDSSIATSRTRAQQVIREIIGGLTRIETADKTVSVRLDGSSTGEDPEPWSRSTVRRELQYLQAHTVHHYALIAFILRLQGQEPSAAFGVAPSTLRHRRATAHSAAR